MRVALREQETTGPGLSVIKHTLAVAHAILDVPRCQLRNVVPRRGAPNAAAQVQQPVDHLRRQLGQLALIIRVLVLRDLPEDLRGRGRDGRVLVLQRVDGPVNGLSLSSCIYIGTHLLFPTRVLAQRSRL